MKNIYILAEPIDLMPHQYFKVELQNIPIPVTPEGKAIRKAFPESTDCVYVNVDYAQIE